MESHFKKNWCSRHRVNIFCTHFPNFLILIQLCFSQQEPVVEATEIGEDMDSIELQQKEYDEFKKDMEVQEGRIKDLQVLCLQLQKEKSSQHEKVQEILTVSVCPFYFILATEAVLYMSNAIRCVVWHSLGIEPQGQTFFAPHTEYHYTTDPFPFSRYFKILYLKANLGKLIAGQEMCREDT